MNPNIIIIGVPRSGTSIVASMIERLGWNYSSDSNWGGESKAVFSIHQNMVDIKKRDYIAERFDEDRAREVLRGLKAPWVIKDPSWSFTLPVWAPLLREASGDRPLVVIWATRDPAEAQKSWRRRTLAPDGGTYVRPDGIVASKKQDVTFHEWFAQAQRTFDDWEGVKIRVYLTELKEAVAIFDTSRHRTMMRHLRTWCGFRLKRAVSMLGIGRGRQGPVAREEIG